MTILVPLMLFGWIPISIIAFYKLPSHRAVLFTIIGGTLFLPQAGYDISGFPNYTKTMSIAISLIVGARISGKRRNSLFRWELYEIPLALFCLTSIISSLSNSLGLYNGLSGLINNIVFFAIPYLAGRMYFSTLDSLHDICLGIIIGGLIYTPLCLFEIRMSPQLSNIFYGFFPHSFLQHIRYGGFRPIVFMSHGLQVSLWMAISSVVAYWYWRSKKISTIAKIPIPIIVVCLIGTTILCKSANGWFTLVLGFTFFYLFKTLKTNTFFLLVLGVLFLYPVLRTSGIISSDNVQQVAEFFFDKERIQSLEVRLLEEDLYIVKSLEKPVWGWNTSQERLPLNEKGDIAIAIIDSLWLIFFNVGGFLGIYSFYSAVLLGPWLVLRHVTTYPISESRKLLEPTLLAVVILFISLDSLVNAMSSPIFFMISGALISFHINQRDSRTRLTSESNDNHTIINPLDSNTLK